MSKTTGRLAALAVCAVFAGCGAAQNTARHRPTTAAVTATPPPPVSCRSVGGIPDIRCTPGATNPAVTQANIRSTICKPGWTATIRPPVSYTNTLKASQMAAYGDTGPLSNWEEDHRVPLEVGGNPTDPANLWPEPWAGTQGAHTKDAVENSVHRSICAGRITLAAGQAVFLANYFAWKTP